MQDRNRIPNGPRRVWGALAAAALTMSWLVPQPAGAEPALAVEVPPADILDVSFTAAGPVEKARELAPSVTRGEPVIVDDEQLVAHVAEFNGRDAYQYEFVSQYPAMADGFSLECTFKVTKPLTGSTTSICSGKEIGGMGIGANASGVRAHVNAGSTVNLQAPIETDRWHTALATWDGEELNLYLDGELANSAPLTGALRTPTSAAATDIVIGGDITANNGSHEYMTGAVASTRVWSETLTPAQALQLAQDSGVLDGTLDPEDPEDPVDPDPGPEVPEAPELVAVPAAGILDVDFASGAPKDRARGVTPVTSGSPVLVNDHSIGQRAAGFDGDDAYSFELWSQYNRMADGFTLECVLRPDAPNGGRQGMCSSKEAGGLGLGVENGGLRALLNINGTNHVITTPLDADRWYHVAMTWDGAKMQIFVDGELVDEIQTSGALRRVGGMAESLVLGGDITGSDGVSEWARGRIASARVYDEVLDQAQLRTLAWTSGVTSRGTTAGPLADVLDIAFVDGAPVEMVKQAAPAGVTGSPNIAMDAALGREAATFGLDSAYRYELWDQAALLLDGFSVECVFRLDGEQSGSTQSICSSKESGGFGIGANSQGLRVLLHAGGSNKTIQTPLEVGVWYHSTLVWDTTQMLVYLDGELVEAVSAPLPLKVPTGGAVDLVVGGDITGNRNATEFSDATVSAARVHSDALTASEVSQMYAQALADRSSARSEVTRTVPAEGAHLTSPVSLDVEFEGAELVIGEPEISIDGSAVQVGDLVGPGLPAGDHVLRIAWRGAFGESHEHLVQFSSAGMPEAGGTASDVDGDTATLTARTTPSAGSDGVTTRFIAADVTSAVGALQGTVKQMPTTLTFSHDDGEIITDEVRPGDGNHLASPVGVRAIPFQRFDVPASGDGTEQLSWSGTVDPGRTVKLSAWDAQAREWAVVASSTGSANGSVELTGALPARLVSGGVVRVLVTAEDPFLDDDEKPTDNRFESPDDYDFAFVHMSDTQFISDNAVSAPLEDQHVWRGGYEGMTKWIAENKDDRKIVYAAHSGDIVQGWDARHTDVERADAEYTFASGAQRFAEEAGVVTATVAGDNDNKAGGDEGPGAKYNQYFGPDRYRALVETDGWKEHDAAFEPWREGDALNSYTLFTAGGLDFLSMNLSYGVTAEETAWADEVLKRFPDRNAFIVTHSYSGPASSPDGIGGGLSGNGIRLFQDVVSKNPNVFMTLSGHVGGVSATIRRDAAEPGHHVVEMLADYQFYRFPIGDLGISGEYGDYPNSSTAQFGAAFLRLLQFNLERGTLSVDSYSPHLGLWGVANLRGPYTPEAEQFEVPIQLNSRSTSFTTDGVSVISMSDDVLGEVTTADGVATVTWEDLAPSTTYAWYALSRDAGTEFESGVGVEQFGTFTTEAWEVVVPTPTVTVTQTAEPTVTPTVTLTTEPTATPTVTLTATATATSEPTRTTPGVTPTTPSTGDVYSSPGYHEVGGRLWFTNCEPYSQTVRCHTYIWATQIQFVAGEFVSTTDWHFNNLTYLPEMTREQWAGNPLGQAGEWTSEEGRRWRTECDTAATGRGGCRSYIWTDLVTSEHSVVQDWVFNNMVRFKGN